MLSKLITDSDTYFANSATAAEDQYNRRLEKSIGAVRPDPHPQVLHDYDLPFGRGQHWVNHGFLSQVIGGWRVGGDSGL